MASSFEYVLINHENIRPKNKTLMSIYNFGKSFKSFDLKILIKMKNDRVICIQTFYF